MNLFSRIQPKLILAFLVVVLLPLLGTSLYGNWVTSQALEQVALDNTRHQIERLAINISKALTGLKNEVVYLSQLDNLANLLVSRAQGKVETQTRLTQDFLTYAQNHSSIHQIRYLDETGQEIVRIDCQTKICQPRSIDQLQNKADRYYFSKTMQLAAGQVYVSPLDLNREFGQIEKPHRPVIRLAVPIFFPTIKPNNQTNRAGMVIINVSAQPILDAVYRTNTDSQNVVLANADGYYLAHPDAKRLWGGPENLNTNEGLAHDYNDLRFNFFTAKENLFYYPAQAGWQQLAIQLLPPGLFIANQQIIVFRHVIPFGQDGPFWVLFSDQPRATLIAPIDNFRWTAIATLSIAALAALAMALSLARHLTISS